VVRARCSVNSWLAGHGPETEARLTGRDAKLRSEGRLPNHDRILKGEDCGTPAPGQPGRMSKDQQPFPWESEFTLVTFVTFCSNVPVGYIANQQGLGLLNIQVVRGADFSARVIYSDQVAGSILFHADGDVTRGKRK
jgi:hypothetical protein